MRGLVAGLLLLVGLVLVPFADLGIWTRRELLPSGSFTDVATDVMKQDAVQAALASRLVDELVAREPRLRLGRFVLEPVMREVLDSDQFEAVFRASVASTHAQLERGDDELTLNLDAVLPIVRDLVAEIDEGLASNIPDAVGLPAITVLRQEQVPELWFGVEATRQASWVFPVLMILAFAAAIVVARQRALMLVIVGFGVALVCLVLVLALRTGRDMLSDVVGPVIDVRAFHAGYEVVTDGLVIQTLALGILGLLAAAVGGVLLLRRRASVRPTEWA